MPYARYQVEHDAGVERAAARAHGQAVERGEAHGAVDAAAGLHGAHAGAAAEMGDDHPAVGDLGRDLPAGRGRCIRRTGRGSRSGGCPRRRTGAAGRTSRRPRDGRGGRRYRSTRPAAARGRNRGDRADAGEVVRLVQRRERHQRARASASTAGSTRTGARVVGAAMHHPVADADQRACPRAARAASRRARARTRRGRRSGSSGQRRSTRPSPAASSAVKRGAVPMPSIWPLAASSGRSPPATLVDREFQARGAGVDGQDRVRHGGSLRRRARSRPAGGHARAARPPRRTPCARARCRRGWSG